MTGSEGGRSDARDGEDVQQRKRFLVFGGTGRTGQHFVSLALREGHRVRALARDPRKFGTGRDDLEVVQGSITDVPDLDALLRGADAVMAMLGDVELQQHGAINTAFVRRLVPAMRRTGVTRFLYQAGALSAPPDRRLPAHLRAIRSTLPRGYKGQHEDNEAVMTYLTEEAGDLEWMVHRAAIGSDGPSKGVLQRSARRVSIATFADCAAYGYRTLQDPSAIHTCDTSSYGRG